MKKLLLIFVALLLMLSARAQGSVGDLIREYRHYNGYYSISVGRGLMWLASCFDDENDELYFLRQNVRKIRVLVSERGSKTFNADFIDAVNNDGYANILEINDGADVIKCFAREGKRNHRQFALMLSSSSGEQFVVLLSGRFTNSDIRKICSQKVDWVNV